MSSLSYRKVEDLLTSLLSRSISFIVFTCDIMNPFILGTSWIKPSLPNLPTYLLNWKLVFGERGIMPVSESFSSFISSYDSIVSLNS